MTLITNPMRRAFAEWWADWSAVVHQVDSGGDLNDKNPRGLAERWDDRLWKYSRAYRRREQRKRVVRSYSAPAPRVRCEWCNGTIEVLMLKNGSRICMSCQDQFR
jgi:hypothetical protein